MREGRGEQRKIGCVGECVCPCGRDSPRRRESVKKGSTRVWMASGLSEEGGAGRDAFVLTTGAKLERQRDERIKGAITTHSIGSPTARVSATAACMALAISSREV